MQFVDDGNEAAPAFDVTVNDGTGRLEHLVGDHQLTRRSNDAPVLDSASLAVSIEGRTVTWLVFWRNRFARV